MGKYVLKYAVVYEMENGDWELAGDEFFDNEEDAIEFIKEMEDEE